MRLDLSNIDWDRQTTLGGGFQQRYVFGSTATTLSVEQDETQRSIDLVVSIQDSNGDPLRGAIINDKTYDGDRSRTFDHRATFTYNDYTARHQSYNTYGWPNVPNYEQTTDHRSELQDVSFEPYTFVVFHGGRNVLDREVSQDEFTRISDTRYEITLTVNDTHYGEEFSGAKAARKVGNKLAVTWDPVQTGTSRGYEIYVGPENDAFSSSRQTQEDTNPAGYTRHLASGNSVVIEVPNKETGHALLTWRPFMAEEGAIVAVRELGTSFTGDFVPVEAGLPNGTGTDIGDMTLYPGNGTTRIEGDVFLVWAEVEGPVQPNPEVDFTLGSNSELIASGSQAALVKTNGSGTIEATSVADPSVSQVHVINTQTYEEFVGEPTKPSGLESHPEGAPDSAVVTWDDPGPGHYTRIRLPAFGFVQDTYDTSFEVTGLSMPWTAMVHHVGPTGLVSDHTTVRVEPGEAWNRPVGIVPRALKGIRLSPGSSYRFNLADIIHFYETESDKDPIVKPANHGPDEVTVTQPSKNSLNIDVALDASAQADSGNINVILVEILRSPEESMWVALPVTRGPTTEVMQARGVNSYPVEWLRLASPSLESMVGAGGDAVPLRDISSSLVRATDDIRLTDDGSLNAFTTGARRPALIVLQGDKGVACFCAVDRPGPAHVVPVMPDPDLNRVERFDGVIDFNTKLYKPDASPDQWRRVETTDGQLWNVGLGELPEKVYQEPPVYYGTTWLNEDPYPEDAEIDWDAGLVRYRQGFESPSADEADLDVDRLQITTVEEGFDVEWDVTVDGYSVDGLVTLTVTPSDTDRDPFTLSGDGEASVRGLDADLSYEVVLGSKTETVQPLQPRPTLSVKARRTPGLTYKYIYDSDASPDLFTDGFETEHESPEFPLEVTSGKVLREHGVRFEWNTDESFTRRTSAEWTLPSEPVTEEIGLGVGVRMKAQEVPTPTFEAGQFSGTTTQRLDVNTFRPGRYRIEPVGYLPIHLSGELEDHVQVWFKGPDGEDLGSEIEISQPTELEVWAEVVDVDRMSPVLLGARIAYWR